MMLRWRAHPLRQNARKSLLLIAIVLGILGIVQVSFGEVMWTAVSGLLLVSWLVRGLPNGRAPLAVCAAKHA
jgi:hypothetical protein